MQKKWTCKKKRCVLKTLTCKHCKVLSSFSLNEWSTMTSSSEHDYIVVSPGERNENLKMTPKAYTLMTGHHDFLLKLHTSSGPACQDPEANASPEGSAALTSRACIQLSLQGNWLLCNSAGDAEYLILIQVTNLDRAHHQTCCYAAQNVSWIGGENCRWACCCALSTVLYAGSLPSSS